MQSRFRSRGRIVVEGEVATGNPSPSRSRLAVLAARPLSEVPTTYPRSSVQCLSCLSRILPQLAVGRQGSKINMVPVSSPQPVESAGCSAWSQMTTCSSSNTSTRIQSTAAAQNSATVAPRRSPTPCRDLQQILCGTEEVSTGTVGLG